MRWESLAAMAEELALKAPPSDSIGLRQEIYARLKLVHPDQHPGETLSDDEQQHMRLLTEALNFLDSQGKAESTSLVVPDKGSDMVPAFTQTLEAFTKTIDTLTRRGFEPTVPVEQRISQAQRDRIRSSDRARRVPQISVAGIAAVITILYALPAQAKDNPLLEPILTTSWATPAYVAAMLVLLLVYVLASLWGRNHKEALMRAFGLNNQRDALALIARFAPYAHDDAEDLHLFSRREFEVVFSDLLAHGRWWVEHQLRDRREHDVFYDRREHGVGSSDVSQLREYFEGGAHYRPSGVRWPWLRLTTAFGGRLGADELEDAVTYALERFVERKWMELAPSTGFDDLYRLPSRE